MSLLGKFAFNDKNIFLGVIFGILLLWGQQAVAANLINNPGFEEGKAGWNIFVPGESKDKGCSFEISDAGSHAGKGCAKLQVSDFARFGVGQIFKVTTGQHLKVSAWVRADVTAVAKEKTPGFLLRMLWRANNKDVGQGMTYLIGTNSTVTFQELSKGLKLDKIIAPLPQQWTKVEAVIEIPQVVNGAPSPVDAVELGFFFWYAKGTIYIDEVSVEDVGKETPVSQVF